MSLSGNKELFLGLESSLILFYENFDLSSPIALKSHTNSVTSLFQNQNGLLSVSKDGTVKLWDLNRNRPK